MLADQRALKKCGTEGQCAVGWEVVSSVPCVGGRGEKKEGGVEGECFGIEEVAGEHFGGGSDSRYGVEDVVVGLGLVEQAMALQQGKFAAWYLFSSAQTTYEMRPQTSTGQVLYLHILDRYYCKL